MQNKRASSAAGSLTLLQLRSADLSVVDEWWQDCSPAERPATFLPLGGVDLCLIALNPRQQRKVVDLLHRLDPLTLSGEGTKQYQCSLEWADQVRHLPKLGTLVMVSSPPKKEPRQARIRWKTNGFYSQVYLLERESGPGGFAATYAEVVDRLRCRGINTYTLPLVAFEFTRGTSRSTTIEEAVAAVVARVNPGFEREARQRLQRAVRRSVVDRSQVTPKVILAHGDIDLLVPGSHRVCIATLVRMFWQMRRDAPRIASIRTRLSVELKDGDITAPPAEFQEWPASPFSVPDVVAGVDRTKHLATLKGLYRETLDSLSSFEKIAGLKGLRGLAESVIRVRFDASANSPSSNIGSKRVECVFQPGLLDDPDWRLYALHEFSCAIGLPVLTSVAGVGSKDLNGGRSHQAIAYTAAVNLNEALATAIGLLYCEQRNESIAEYHRKVSLAESHSQGMYLRLLSGIFLSKLIDQPVAPVSSVNGFDWLGTLIQSEKDLAKAWSRPLEYQFPTRLDVARTVFLGAWFRHADLDYWSKRAYCQLMDRLWEYAIILGRCIVARLRLRSRRQRQQHHFRGHSFQGLNDLAFFRSLMIESAAFAETFDRDLEVSEVAEALNRFALIIDRIESIASDRIEWSIPANTLLLPENLAEHNEGLSCLTELAVAESELDVAQRCPNPGKLAFLYPAARYSPFVDLTTAAGVNRGGELLAQFAREPGQSSGAIRICGTQGALDATYGLLLKEFVRLGRDTSLGGETELARLFVLEEWCLQAAIVHVESKRDFGGAPVSVNLTPWLLGAPRWGDAFSFRIARSVERFARSVRKRNGHPIVEITEGAIAVGDEVWRHLWALLEQVHKKVSIGLAIDDQFGPGTDFERLTALLDAARGTYSPLVVKVDHTAVRALLRRAANRESRVLINQGLHYVAATTDALAGPVDILVFEGWSGWDRAAVTQHQAVMGRALLETFAFDGKPAILVQGR